MQYIVANITSHSSSEKPFILYSVFTKFYFPVFSAFVYTCFFTCIYRVLDLLSPILLSLSPRQFVCRYRIIIHLYYSISPYNHTIFSLRLVGSSGFEPPTLRLSGARSNHLSYEPVFFLSPVKLRFTSGNRATGYARLSPPVKIYDFASSPSARGLAFARLKGVFSSDKPPKKRILL